MAKSYLTLTHLPPNQQAPLPLPHPSPPIYHQDLTVNHWQVQLDKTVNSDQSPYVYWNKTKQNKDWIDGVKQKMAFSYTSNLVKVMKQSWPSASDETLISRVDDLKTLIAVVEVALQPIFKALFKLQRLRGKNKPRFNNCKCGWKIFAEWENL